MGAAGDGGEDRARTTAHIAGWARDLIDLTQRNLALYHRPSRRSSLDLHAPDPLRLHAGLTEKRSYSFFIPPAPPARDSGSGPTTKSRWTIDQSLEMARPNELVTDRTDGADLLKTLTNLLRTTNQDWLDRAVRTLYVAFGQLVWTEDLDGRETVRSPLIYLPVSLRRGGAKDPFILEPTEEDVVLNPSLIVKLKESFGLDIGAVADAVSDAGTLDEVFEALEEAVDPLGWTVEHAAALKRSTFHKESMYRDLLANTDLIADHPLVQSLAGSRTTRVDNPLDGIPGPDRLDDAVAPETTHLVLDADSSQRRAVLAAVDGLSFVMDGPPGTGKSQTIVNMIAELIANGKSVLFVSEKAAALEVVAKRLEAAGLHDFVLELHSHRASRKEVVSQLAEALRRRPEPSGGLTDAERQRLRDARVDLTEYADAVNEPRSPLGRSLGWAVGRLAELDDAPRLETGVSDSTKVSATVLESLREDLIALALTWDRVQSPLFRWRDLDATNRRPSEQADVLVEAALAAIQAIRDLLAPFAHDLALPNPGSSQEAAVFVDLLGLASDRPELAPAEWLASDESTPTTELTTTLRRSLDEIRAVDERIDSAYRLDWDRAPLPALEDLQGISLAALTDVDATTPITVEMVEHVVAAERRLADLLDEVSVRADDVAAACGTRTERLTLDQVHRLAAVATRADASVRPDPSWLVWRTAVAVEKAVDQLVELRRRERAALAPVQTLLRPESSGIDLPAAVSRFRSTRRRLSAFGASGRAARAALSEALTVRPTEVEDGQLDQAVSAWRATRELRDAEGRHAQLLSPFRNGRRFDLKAARAALDLAIELRQAAGDDFDAEIGARQFCGDRPESPDLVRRGEQLRTALDELERLRVELGEFGWRRRGVRPWPAQLSDARAAFGEAVALAQLIGPAVSARTVPPSLADLTEEATLVARARTARAELTALGAELAPLLGRPQGGWTIGPDDVATLEAAVRWSDRVRTALSGAIPAGLARGLTTVDVTKAEVDGLERSLTKMSAALTAVAHLFRTAAGRALTAELDRDFHTATETLEALAATTEQIDEWWEHHEALAAVERAGFAAHLAEATEKGLAGNALPGALERTVLSSWVERILETDGRLARIGPGRRDARVNEFRRLDRALHNDAAQRVIRACVARRPRGTVGGASVILKEANKKSRHLPVRQLLQTAGTVVLDLKPCLMMSPMSVSQFLPPDWRFDVLIFDEASQIPPQDAINSVYRATQVIIAGDENQLPPTSFFDLASGDEDEDAEDFVLEEFESVLKLAKSSEAFADLGLKWHYRSRHEDLITFSNHQFYRNELVTYPGAESAGPALGVQHIHVPDGTYRRGGRRDNPAEAEAVAERVAHHLREHPGLSIGVVALSSAQAEAIEDAVDRLRRDNRDLDEAFRSDRLEGFFVKNLENVQGDDRDVIILSIGYGPDEVGKFTMNFGPMNQASGWRRLNVAVTRARMRMEVVSSFTSDRIQVSRPDSSLAHLKAYLEYAERGPISLFDRPTGSLGDVESPLEAEVLRTIRSWGVDAVPQVGTASYRIDIGIRDPRNPDRYVLGVECDGATYHSSRVARDRDRLRQQVLEGLGWRLHRVWGPTWYRSRRKAEEALREAVERALRGEHDEADDEGAQAEPVVVQFVDVDPTAPPDWAEPYVSHAPRPLAGRDPTSPRSAEALQRLIRDIVATEQPIHLERIKTVVAETFGAPRSIGLTNAIVECLRLLALEGTAALDADEFVRVPGEAIRVRYPEHPRDQRSAAELPPEEVRLAVLRIVQDAREVSLDELRRAVRDLFRLARLSQRLTDAVESAVRALEGSGDVTRDGDAVKAG